MTDHYICEHCGKDHEQLSWSQRWECYGKYMEKLNADEKKMLNKNGVIS